MARASAIMVEVLSGAFTGRLGVAVQRDGRWIVRFDGGETYDDVDPAKFKRISTVADIDSLLSVLD